MSVITDSFGTTPISMKWNVVRGDTAKIKVSFLENDETTGFDCSGWEFQASAYDFKTDTTDELEVEVDDHNLTITAPADITQYWGTGYKEKVSELRFDLQVTIDDEIWTPIIGSIVVLGDITGGSL